MSALSEMYEASFRGVPFFAARTTTTGGRRSATHEFVNSDFREVEDLGENLKKFNIVGTINDIAGSHTQLKIDLINALDKKGSGTLSHPFYGEFQVKAKPYTIEEDTGNLGETTFVMSFEIETSQLIISKTFNILGAIVGGKQELSQKLGLDAAKGFFATGIAAIDSATDFIDDISQTFDEITSLYDQAFDSVSNLVASVQGLKNNIVEVVNFPDRMADDLTGLFDRIDDVFVSKNNEVNSTKKPLSDAKQESLAQVDITDTLENISAKENAILETEVKGDLDITESDINIEKFEALESLFSFNKNSTRIEEITTASSVTLNGDDAGITASVTTDIGNEITAEQAEIVNNEKVLTILIRGNALASAYIAASEIDFRSIDEVEDFQRRLENQYQDLVADQEIPNDTLKSLQRLRDIAEGFFFEKKLTTNNIIEIETKPIPAQVLAFSLYGDDENYRDIIALNNEIDVSRITGTKKVITA
jgi:prophage DNA circulation protein